MANNDLNNDLNNPKDPDEDNDMAWLFAGLVVFALIVGAFFVVPNYTNSNNLSTIEPAAGNTMVTPSDNTGGYTAPDTNNNNALPPQPTPAPSNP